jgi:sugar lactone lactonase YvrE
MIYIGSVDGKLYAISPAGVMEWEFDTGDWICSSPALGLDNTIYVGSQNGGLYAINPDGSRKWVFETGGYVDSSSAIGTDGTLYVGSTDGNLYAINTESRGPASASWPMFHHDLKHTGRVEKGPLPAGGGSSGCFISTLGNNPGKTNITTTGWFVLTMILFPVLILICKTYFHHSSSFG